MCDRSNHWWPYVAKHDIRKYWVAPLISCTVRCPPNGHTITLRGVPQVNHDLAAFARVRALHNAQDVRNDLNHEGFGLTSSLAMLHIWSFGVDLAWREIDGHTRTQGIRMAISLAWRWEEKVQKYLNKERENAYEHGVIEGIRLSREA